MSDEFFYANELIPSWIIQSLAGMGLPIGGQLQARMFAESDSGMRHKEIKRLCPRYVARHSGLWCWWWCISIPALTRGATVFRPPERAFLPIRGTYRCQFPRADARGYRISPARAGFSTHTRHLSVQCLPLQDDLRG
ncbi:MAG: hypothetical protein EDM75_02215 [Chlorobiota bacterium]|nr:MAG: hypothetical protein EDM75_02215 [Chlorobiota bacterium]